MTTPSHPSRRPEPSPSKPAAHRTARPMANPVNKVQPVSGDFQLDRAMTVLGIKPEDLDGGQSMLVDAWFPDGRIEHLVWLREYRKEWTREYLFRAPLRLPAGTTIHVKAPSPRESSTALLTATRSCRGRGIEKQGHPAAMMSAHLRRKFHRVERFLQHRPDSQRPCPRL